MDWATGLEIAGKLGIGALFLAMYLVTIGMLIKNMKEQQKDTKEMMQKVITALESSTTTIQRFGQLLDHVNTAVDNLSRQTNEFVAYLRGRDSRRE